MPQPRPDRPLPDPTPIPAPADAHALLLFGGSFDPPTIAHTSVAADARSAALGSGAWLCFVPAARSPFKPDPPAPDDHRVAMLRLAIGAVPKACVWTDEIDRAAAGQPSYWIDTLRRARAQRPGAGLRFLIGADQAAEFHRWKDARAVLSLAPPLVYPREPLETPQALRERLEAVQVWTDSELDRWSGAMLDLPTTPGSATDVRRALASGAPAPGLLAPEVAAYIRQHRLYT
jgi:nicotinate-nucleotide adenylyltransferase